jgi:prepilin-type N-terminal cleavage/methylation domain-containing protein
MIRITDRAFSLVELMVVIVIIGILSAIAVPVYNGYIRKAKLMEGTIGVDIISKNQIKFYLENKEFAYAPGKPRHVPNSKLRFESEPSEVNDTQIMNYWSRVGFAVPIGAETGFQYQTFGGKNTSAGTQINRGGAGDGWSTNVVAPGVSTSAPAEGGGRCMIGNNPDGQFRTGDYITPAGKPDYAWSFVLAIANMKLDDPGVNNPCTLLYKLVDLGDNGKINGSHPIANLFVGE